MQKEYVEAIFYRKITRAEFNVMYKLFPPTTGGGQTYIDTSGIRTERLKLFFTYAEVNDVNQSEPSYHIPTYVLGKRQSKDLVFQPRYQRKVFRNYCIQLQQLDKIHPAWKQAAFPKPNQNPDGSYDNAPNYANLYKYLMIFVIRTSYRKYYAGFINQKDIPATWPQEDDLKQVVHWVPAGRDGMSENGLLIFDESKYEFRNNAQTPFVLVPEDQRFEFGVITAEAVQEIIESNEKFNFDKMEYEIAGLPVGVNVTFAANRGTVSPKQDYERMQKTRTKRGDLGEEIVVRLEKERLVQEGLSAWADEVEWISKDSDSYGFDIRSFEKDSAGRKRERRIEVKTTTGNKNTLFYISEGELLAADEAAESNVPYYIFRVFGLNTKKSVFGLYVIGDSEEEQTSIREKLNMQAINYLAIP